MFRALATAAVLLLVLAAPSPSFGKHGADGGGVESPRGGETGRSGRSGSSGSERLDDRSRSSGSNSSGGREAETREPERSSKDDSDSDRTTGETNSEIERTDNSGSNSGSSGRGGNSTDDNETDDEDAASGDHGKTGGTTSEDSGSSALSAFQIKRDPSGYEYFDGDTIVAVPDERSVAELGRAGFTVRSKDYLKAAGLILVRLRGAESNDAILSLLHKRNQAAAAALNHVYRPNWGSESGTNLDTAPPRKSGRVAVGLIDARIDAAHPMLRNLKIKSAQFEDGSPSKTDHATALASVIAARQEQVDLFAASVFIETTGDGIGASALSIARALDWLSLQGVGAVNVSLSGPPNSVLEQVIARLSERGQTIVAAVGNDGPGQAVKHPAAYRNVVGVTAVDAGHHIYRYANRGPGVDFSAIGVGIRVAANGGATRVVSGTSFAAPIVALELARLTAELGDPIAAQKALQQSALDLGAPGCDAVYGCGLVGESLARDTHLR